MGNGQTIGKPYENGVFMGFDGILSLGNLTYILKMAHRNSGFCTKNGAFPYVGLPEGTRKKMIGDEHLELFINNLGDWILVIMIPDWGNLATSLYLFHEMGLGYFSLEGNCPKRTRFFSILWGQNRHSAVESYYPLW